MPKRLTPVTIITVLKKAKKAYQKEDPNPKDEAELRHRKIDEDLKVLRRFARKEETGADLEKVFEARKLQCIRKLKVHRKKLKDARDKDPNKNKLTKYLEALGKLTLSVKRLKFNTLSDEEETDLNPDALEAESEEDLRELDVEESEDEAPASNGEAAAPPRGDEAATFKSRLQALMPGYQNALKAKPANLGALEQAMKLTLAAARSQDYEQGLVQLDTLQDELDKAGAPSPDAATPPDLAATFKSRLQALTPGYQNAFKARPANLGALELAMKLTLAAARSQDYQQGLVQLDKLEAELNKTGAQAPAAPAEDLTAVFKSRVQAFRPSFNQVLTQARGHDPELARELDGLFAQMFDEAKARNFEKALQTLEELTRLVKSAAAGSAAADGKKARPSFVNYAKARLDWLTTRQKVAGGLQKLEKAILDTYKDTAGFAIAQSSVRRLDNVLKNLDESLADKLDEGLNAADEATRAAVNKQASAIIERYTTFLYTNPLVTRLDDNPFVPLSVQKDLATTLGSLADQLA
jgi:hypothetical protein